MTALAVGLKVDPDALPPSPINACASWHAGDAYTDSPALHAPSKTGMDAAYAACSATGLYRTMSLRGLWQHPPYFHDGSAATLADVVATTPSSP
jgi:cytochrome c peroxidase